MKSSDIRRQFIAFFESKAHAFVPSSPVVPQDDPTLMFTNAGMNQFKPIFLGTERATQSRVANSQKCIRAGGKHNDLDDVGQDTYHHTFFEMLGNWSFGDYFKKEAIAWAWELLTKVFGIDKTRLHATYFGGLREGTEARRHEGTKEGTNPPLPPLGKRGSEGGWELEPDSEARELWASVTDIDPSHIHPGNMKDNFWEMGDSGPCGPCSEIHIDLTPDKSGADLVNKGDARVMEIWNLVFIQYNRGSDGKLTPLPAKHVDTGMGFERLCAVLQKKTSNYDTDVFTPIFEAIKKRTNAPAYTGLLPDQNRDGHGAGGEVQKDTPPPPPLANGAEGDQGGSPKGGVLVDVSYRVIADHVRCLTFALTDGAIPSNEGRGYVLRRILRRAVRYGRQYLNMHEPFLCDLVPTVIEHMGDTFPELRTAHRGKNVEHVVKLIREEEESFLNTLDRGIHKFELSAARLIGSAISTSIGSKFAKAIHCDTEGGLISWTLQFESPGSSVRQIELGALSSRSYKQYISHPLVFPGRDAFVLYDTFGFPLDLTQLIANEIGLTVDLIEYERLLDSAREWSRGRNAEAPDRPSANMWEEIDWWFTEEPRRGRKEPNESQVCELDRATEEPPEPDYYDETPKFLPVPRCHARIVGLGVSVAHGSNPAGSFVKLDRTPFYVEQGGQVGDTGSIRTISGESVDVVHVSRSDGGVVHRYEFSGKRPLDLGMRCEAIVSLERRIPIMQNHTATHIMNWALREVLCPADERMNPHVQQKGSLVDPEKTRFDFSHNHALTGEEISRIETLVKRQIGEKLEVHDLLDGKREVEQKAAREINTLRAVFGEKYPDIVRVVSIGPTIKDLLANPKSEKWMQYSVEFCGGTHVRNSGEIGEFVLVSEEAVAKGIRRVVGLTGERATEARTWGEHYLAVADALRRGITPPNPPLVKGGGTLTDLAGASSAPPLTKGGIEGGLIQNRDSHGAVPPSSGTYDLSRFLKELSEATIPVLTRHKLADLIAQLQEAAKEEGKKSAAAAQRGAVEAVGDLLAAKAIDVGGVTVLVGEVHGGNADALRNGIDFVRNKKGSSAVLLATVGDGKVTLVAGMSKDVVERGVKAGDLIKDICPLVGGKGGGRPDMAQGGGSDASGLPKALEKATEWIAAKLGG